MWKHCPVHPTPVHQYAPAGLLRLVIPVLGSVTGIALAIDRQERAVRVEMKRPFIVTVCSWVRVYY